VIKLGGSALTDKKRAYTPRMSVIRRAARQVFTLGKRFSIVLVHGAGSYGHIPVKKFALADGFRTPHQIRGLTETKSKLLEWQATLCDVFSRSRVPLMPLLASDFVQAEEGRIASANLDSLRSWLRLGCIPAVGGDIVPDLKRSFSVVSGDQLASYLAIKLKATQLVFGTDVDGIFDSNPKLNSKAKLLSVLTPSSAFRIAGKAAGGTIPDVTGGMAGKIREASLAAMKGIPVYFANLTKDQRLQETVLGKDVLCSKIRPI